MLRMWANIHITPAEIARSVYECGAVLATFPHDLGKATVCLHVSQSPKNQLGESLASIQDDLPLGVPRPRAPVSSLAPFPLGSSSFLSQLFSIPHFPLQLTSKAL